MCLDLSSNRYQAIKACAECDKPFKVNSRLCHLLLEEDYLFKSVADIPEYMVHAGYYATPILIPKVVCSSCFKELVMVMTGEDRHEADPPKEMTELNTDYKIDEGVLFW